MKENYKLYLNEIDNIKKLKAYSFIAAIAYIISINLMIVKIQQIIDMLSIGKLYVDVYIILQYVVLLILFFLSSFTFQCLFRQISIKGKNRFLQKLYQKLLLKPYLFFQEYSEAEITSLFQNEAVILATTISTSNLVILVQSITLVVSLSIMATYHLLLTCIVLSLIFACFLFTNILSVKIAESNNKIYTQKGILIKLILETIENIKTIKQLRKENVTNSIFSNFLNQNLYTEEKKQAKYSSIYLTIYSLLSLGIPLMSIGIGILFVIYDNLTIGELLAIYTLVTQTQEPIRVIADTVNEKNTAYKLADKISSLFYDNGEEIGSREESIASIQEISININTFYYGNNKVLENLIFEFKKVDICLIEGESGSGKSTLLSLLLQFQTLMDGQITINGVDSKRIKLENLYEQILLVDQNLILIEGTICENICFYDTYSFDDIMEVMRICCIEDLYREHGENYVFKPYSNNLSGGQIQRICIARMLIRKPSLLILDEPTSALDNETGEKLSKNLKLYAQIYGLSYLIISHKKDIKQICNIVIQMNKVK